MQTIDYFRVRHGGQICDGLKRLFVHESQYDELISHMKGYFQDMIIWNPLNPETRLGCLISEKAKETILKQIEDSLPYGFEKIELWQYDGTDWVFMPFTLLVTDVITTQSEAKGRQSTNLFQAPCLVEEVFWPVLPIISYSNIEEAIQYANNTVYGLGWYVRWKNQPEIDYVCSRLKTGNINVNNTNYVVPQVPFGGYTPMSGNFREHGIIWLRNYTEIKVVSKPI